MKNYLLYMLFFTFCNGLFAASSDPKLKVTLSDPKVYLSQKNEKFVVYFGKLSDESLSFIRIRFPDGNEKTLPQVLSGSGMRYSDERILEWREHQGVVCLSKRDEKTQEWIKCYWEFHRQ